MDKTIVALYDNRDDAQKAIKDLVDHGINRNEISLVTSHSQENLGAMHAEETPNSPKVQRGEPVPGEDQPSVVDSEARTGAGIGAILGGVGGLLVGLGALAIPGIGPVLAAGPLAAALGGVAGAGTGAIAGGAAGGIVGALSESGVPKETAGYYEEGIRRGGTLVTMRLPDLEVDNAKRILDQHHPVDINERATQWRQSGWSGFQPREEPFAGSSTPAPTGTLGQQPTMTPHQESTEQRENEELGDKFGHPMGIDAERMRTGGTETSQQQGQVRSFDQYEAGFRSHYVNNFSDRGYGYNQYMPAYRYGYDLANNERYSSMDWNLIEPDARNYWEERHPGTWPDFRDAVYYAWIQARNPGR